MKKVVFSIQMIALMAMFPVYLAVELNHKTGNVRANNPASKCTKMPKENNIQPAHGINSKGMSLLMFETVVY